MSDSDVKKSINDKPVILSSNALDNRGFAFWMIIVSIWACDCLSAIDLTAVSTALPTIVEHLDGADFIWAGSAYALASTAILPMCGGLASIFGRKPLLLIAVSFFGIGSIICGAAQNINMLIAGRAIQGFGGGGCLALTEIVFSDLIPLPERGKFIGFAAAIWAFASAIGPPIGGALASSGAWRWLFFLNLPVCGIVLALVTFFLRVKTPRDDFKTRISRMDWLGNLLLIGITTALVLALTWGGLRFPWVSVQVLLPLCIAAVGVPCLIVVEVYWSKDPMIPWRVIANRTSVSGYLSTFIHGIVSIAIIYYLPVYLQAVHLASPIHSGVEMFGLAFTIAPVAIITGACIQITQSYRIPIYIGWIITTVGFGVMTLLDISSDRNQFVGFQIIVGVGLGMLWIGAEFAILSPLPYSNNAHALACFVFTRCLAQSLGIAIGGAVIQNTLQKNLPPQFSSIFPAGAQIAYSAIPKIRTLEQPLKNEVRMVFDKSTHLLWLVLIGISGVGFLSALFMKDVPMRSDMDEQWALREIERPIATSSKDPEVRVSENHPVEIELETP